MNKVVDKDERKAANRRAKEIAVDPGNVGPAVRSALVEAQLAISAAVAAASVSSGDGGGGGG